MAIVKVLQVTASVDQPIQEPLTHGIEIEAFNCFEGVICESVA